MIHGTRGWAERTVPREIAPGVYSLGVGKGIMRSNVYFLRSGTSWALIDAGSANDGGSIKQAAGSLFGKGSAPAAIFLTHDHPDHVGSARELAHVWNCPVWVHPDELPLALGDIATIHKYAHPLDRWVVLPLLRLLGRKRMKSIVSKASLGDVVRRFDPAADLPGLPDWEAVPTPGHTPGHVAFFRRSDRVLITGDALVTVKLNSLVGLMGKQTVAAPPWYTTWNWSAAKQSVATLAKLEPLVLASGHGIPMTASDTPNRVQALSDRLPS